MSEATAHAQSTGRSHHDGAAKAELNEKELTLKIMSFKDDPYGFVMWALPWGRSGTILEKETGPDIWQTKFLGLLREELLKRKDGNITRAIQMAVSSGHGAGKAHPTDMKLDTPTGVRRWGDLKPGDTVFGRDGKPTRIAQIHPQGIKPIYRVIFDDESSTLTCAEHLWLVKERRKDWETKSTAEIAETGPRRKNGQGRARRFQIPRHGAVEYPYQWVNVDPYTLGAWLGDGCRNTSRITNMDAEVFERIASARYRLTEGQSKRETKAKVFNVGHLRPALERLGVDKCGAREKHVPDIYKYNLREVREEVLRGLMDTDGYVSDTGCAQYCSVSKLLIEDVIWLTRSIGGKARLHSKTHNGAYLCSLTFPDGFTPCYIKRKAERIRPTSQKRYLERFIDRVELAGEAECMCITVEAEDQLYLANDFIVTHNTALVAWIILWFMSTRTPIKAVVTANTKMQLTDKTWMELSKWHQMVINQHWFEWTATKFRAIEHPTTHFMTAAPWSKQNTEAFAGTHEENVLMIFDEASAIDDKIWEVASGAMTTTGSIWICFGNPTRNVGRFRACWTKFRKRWVTFKVDSRTAKKAEKQLIQEWIDDYGEDSDFVRVRVKGEFPRASSMQFIALDWVEEARKRKLDYDLYKDSPIVIGVDVARFGDDRTVIVIRQGLRILEIREYRELDNMTIVSLVQDAEDEYGADAVFIDETGPGTGVIDRGRQLKCRWFSVVAGSRSSKKKYFNKRAEMWGNMREWLKTADLSGLEQREYDYLETDLTSIEYGFSVADKIQLERKEHMKARELDSPDFGDALAQTFAFRIKPVEYQRRENKTYKDSLQHRRHAALHRQRDKGKSPISGY
ncbi:MAG: hypothetical protein KOO63_05645 [Bacteroidales bacterium]|nr:hypothetical protein [Candidatus Latescibacterota bacterium]